jgi:hypothetical protein
VIEIVLVQSQLADTLEGALVFHKHIIHSGPHQVFYFH